MKRTIFCNLRCSASLLIVCFTVYAVWRLREKVSDRTLQFFMDRGHIKRRDAAEVRWSHAVNSRGHLTEALAGETHMMEADVIIRGHDPREPVMAHPPDTDSDVTLREWLEEVKEREKGIKLDFKSLEAVSQSVLLLQEVLDHTSCPLWINADILTGPGGQDRPLDPQSFLSAVRTLPPHTVLSLGWTTGSTAGTDNPGYSWDMVHLMEDICRDLKHAVTFPVRAALLSQSLSQLRWLLQQSDRYSLTVWTGQKDEDSLQDLLSYRTEFDVSRIYYDLPESQRTEISLTTQQNTRKSCLLFICL